MSETMKWIVIAVVLSVSVRIVHLQKTRGCPSQERILPCRCLLRDKEYQIWCSHSDLPRVLEGLKAIGQYIFQPIDELILENNNLPSLPGKAFIPLKVMRLMLRHNGLERVSNGWLHGLEDSLMELFVVEPELRSLPEESLYNLKSLEAVTIETGLMKRIPLFVNLPKLRYLSVESDNLVELTSRSFKKLPELEKVQIHGSVRLERLEAGTFQDLPNLKLINISFCGVNWIHLRAITHLPSLTELSLIGNKLSDAGMVGRGVRDLPSLEIIRLDFNDIERLNEASFVDLQTLKKLYLSNNKITELNHGAFHRVPNLRMVDLNNNRVRRVHPESFLQHSGSGLEEIFLMNNDVSHVAELRSLLDALPRLTFLDMSFNNLEAIPFGALRGHPTLEELHLDYNKIHIIDREAFMAMPALRELRLKNNSLTEHLQTPFWNLPALKGLDLSGNYFRRLEPRLLANLPSLRKLDLSSNDITILDSASFLQTPELERVNLSYNALTTIHPASFRHLLNLYELDVSYNGLLEFVPGLPRGIEYLHIKRNLIANIPHQPSLELDLPALRMLDISQNGIQRIPSAAFRSLPQLKKLYIGRNALQQLEESSFDGLTRLEILDVRENRISKLHPYSLKELTDLQELNLRENRLDVLIPDLFNGLNNLKKLDISRNQLSEILPGTLENSRGLEVMDASHNSLVQLPPGLHGMKSLKQLDLTDNKIKIIHPDTLNSLSSLEDLRMSRNFIQELRSGAFSNLLNLRSLYLDNNELADVEPHAVKSLKSLKSINLSQNRLNEIPNQAFSDLPALQIAELQENELKIIAGGAFHQVPHLLMLNLSFNHFVGMEDAGLASLRSLEMLDLSNNRLSMVASPSLEKMEWLVELRLDNNRICSVRGATFNGMPRLRVLSLRNNKMMTFPEHAVQKLRGNIAVLDIDGNPLACSCSILWLRAWLQEQSIMGPRCSDGSLLREMRLSRQECLEEEQRSIDPVAPGCEAELLSMPGTYATAQVFTQPWMNVRENKTKLSLNNKNHLAPSPEESDYFYDDYVDYPFNNDTSTQATVVNAKNFKNQSSHYIAGDTPVIYAASGRNRTKVPDTPKGVVGSPSSSGFTFFGLPLPNLNLNNILGGNVRMEDPSKRKALTPAESMTAERKTAIVNKPPRMQMPVIRMPPDLPERQNIIGMMPPSHPEIHKGGFVPVVPGSLGGFTPIAGPMQPNKTAYSVNIERVNYTQATSSSVHATSTLPPFSPFILEQHTEASVLSKRGPSTIPTQATYTTTTEEVKETTTKMLDEDYMEEEEDEDEDEVEETTPKIVVTQTVTKATTKRPDIEVATSSGFETFDDIFKEVVDNVSLPPTSMTTEVEKIYTTTPSYFKNENQLKTNIEVISPESSDNHVKATHEVVHDPIHNSQDLVINENQHSPSKKEPIGTPLSALLVPGGQQPQFRPSGRPIITKVQSPHASGTSALQSDIETDDDEGEDITPQAHNRDGKNGFLDETTLSPPQPGDESMNWYFANYNKTNLEPFIGDGSFPTASHSAHAQRGYAYKYLTLLTMCYLFMY